MRLRHVSKHRPCIPTRRLTWNREAASVTLAKQATVRTAQFRHDRTGDESQLSCHGSPRRVSAILVRQAGSRRSRSALMADRNFRAELDRFMGDELQKSDSIRRVLALSEAETDYVHLGDDDLVGLIADVLGTLREALLRVGSEIDAIHRHVRSPPA